MRLTSLELLVILAAVLLGLTPVVVVLSRRHGARLAGIWAPMGIAGIYLWFWSLTEHVRWLAFTGAALLVASYVIQFAARKAGGRPDGTRPSQ